MKSETLHRQDAHAATRLLGAIGLGLGLVAGAAIVLMVLGVRL